MALRYTALRLPIVECRWHNPGMWNNNTSVPIQRTGDTFFDAATRLRNPKRTPLDTSGVTQEIGRHLAADLLDVAGSCRPTRLVRQTMPGVMRPARIVRPHTSTTNKIIAALCQVPALLGAAVGALVDTIVITAALALSLPFVLVLAFATFRRAPAFRINTQGFSCEHLATALQDVIDKKLAKGKRGIAGQLYLDIGRQKTFIAADTTAPFRPLGKQVLPATADIESLVIDRAGGVDQAWLWAVTDTMTQTLGNATFAQLDARKLVTFGGQSVTVNLNGLVDSMSVRRLSPDVVSVRTERQAPNGLEYYYTDSDDHTEVCRDSTPVRLVVEAHIRKPLSADYTPQIRIKTLTFTLLDETWTKDPLHED